MISWQNSCLRKALPHLSSGFALGGHSSAQCKEAALIQIPAERKGKEKKLQMFNVVLISAVFTLFIVIPFSASDVSLLPTGFGEITAENELEKHQTVWVFF